MKTTPSTLATDLHKNQLSQPTSTLNQTNQQIPFITAYGPKTKTPMAFASIGRTKQSFKDECDINHIMARYMKTGVLDFVSKHQGRYGDVTGMDFMFAMEQVSKANSLFHELPSSIRTRFENNPALFLDFVHDPRNEAEMHSLGLMKPDYVPLAQRAPTPVLGVPPVSPQPAKPGASLPAASSNT